MFRDTPTPARPRPADMDRAVAVALSGRDPAELRDMVVAYSRDLRRAGLPPEQALKRVKEVVGLPLPGPAALERLASNVVAWFVDAYYRAEGDAAPT